MPLVFDVYGSMAMFRKSYTTTSSVSFPFPPPTAIAGLLGAIAGFESGSSLGASRSGLWDRMGGTRVALRILRQGTVSSHSTNFWNTKDPNKNPRIQVKHQFIFSPRYRIYVNGELERILRPHLENGTFVFTPFLGVAYALAEISYIGYFRGEKVETDEKIPVDSIIPWQEGMVLDVIASGGAFRERMPFEMDNERALKKVVDVLYSPSPDKKLYLLEKGEIDVSRCDNEIVAWFPYW
jgi:CRISPR-associated protein Cas5h